MSSFKITNISKWEDAANLLNSYNEDYFRFESALYTSNISNEECYRKLKSNPVFEELPDVSETIKVRGMLAHKEVYLPRCVVNEQAYLQLKGINPNKAYALYDFIKTNISNISDQELVSKVKELL